MKHNYTIGQVMAAAETAKTMADVCRSLGMTESMSTSGKGYKIVRKIAGTAVDDFLSAKAAEERRKEFEEAHKEKVCLACGSRFTESVGVYSNGKFCSRRCARSYAALQLKKRMKLTKCPKCGTEFEVDCRASSSALCDTCRKESQREIARISRAKWRLKKKLMRPPKQEKIKEIIEKARKPRAPGKTSIKLGELHATMYKHGYLFTPKRGRNAQRTTILLHKMDNSYTSKLYARYLLEEKLSRFLVGDETVDHIDGDKTNDSIENLQVLSMAENQKKYRESKKHNPPVAQ